MSDDALFCTKCGASVVKTEPKSRNTVFIGIITAVILIFICIAVIGARTLIKREKAGKYEPKEETAIEPIAPAADAPAAEAEPAAPAAEAESAAPAADEAAPAAERLVKVGFVQAGHESDWRTAQTKNFQEVFSEQNGYELNFVDSDSDQRANVEAVRSLIMQGMDYIVINPVAATGWDTVLTECQDAGIPVIVTDGRIEDSDKYAAYVGPDYHGEGEAAGVWLKSYAGSKGIYDINVLVVSDKVGSAAQIGRSDGFTEVANREGWTILDEQTGGGHEAGGQEVMESYSKSYEGQFNVVVCQNDEMAFGAMTAMDNAGVTYGPYGDVILISFGAGHYGLQDVMDGRISVDFECIPSAAAQVEELIKRNNDEGGLQYTEVYMDEAAYALYDQIRDDLYTDDGSYLIMKEPDYDTIENRAW